MFIYGNYSFPEDYYLPVLKHLTLLFYVKIKSKPRNIVMNVWLMSTREKFYKSIIHEIKFSLRDRIF